MKINNLFLVPIIMLLTGCAFMNSSAASSSSSQAARAGGMTLDQAIKNASDEIEEFIPAGTIIGLLNFNSPADRFSEYVLDELTANLVRGRLFTIVDRSEIDLIRNEFNFQYSGEVSDNSIQEYGRLLGAQAIVSGSLIEIGGSYRITIRVLSMRTAAVEVLYRADITNDSRVQALLTGGRTTATSAGSSATDDTSTTVGANATGNTSGSSTGEQGTEQARTGSQVIIVEGSSLAQKFEWIKDNAARNTEYRIEITADESIIPQNLSYSGRNNITIRLTGSGGNRTVSHTGGTGSFFTVGSGVTLILDSGVTLHGRSGNNGAVIRVESGGILIMNDGAKITGNTSSGYGGGVFVSGNASFTMRGGEITNNRSSRGGGVYVSENANFIMTGGEIYINTSTGPGGNDFGSGGGGVYVYGGTFTMRSGEIHSNVASNNGNGGGVCLAQAAGLPTSRFNMEGGYISNNTAQRNGGGVFIGEWGNRSIGYLNMTGGVISGNIAINGGGIFRTGRLNKTGGTIYGLTEGDLNSNRATGNTRSHAVGGNRLRITTAGPRVDLNSGTTGAAGGWEN